MKETFNKGDSLVATNLATNKIIKFKCPADGMCSKMLTRYIVIKKDMPHGKYLFIKQ